MMQNILALGLLAAGAVALPPTATEPQGKFTQPFIGEMQWVGEVFPGKNYTFTGEARDIWNKVIAINPNYVAKDTTTASDSKRGLEQRNKEDNGWCGNFVPGVKSDFQDDACYLYRLGGTCIVNGQTCVRMTCSRSSGSFLCNDNKSKIQPQCTYLAGYITDITGSCWTGGTVQPSQTPYMSGQEFDTDGYNVVLAGSNCNAAASVQPARPTGTTPPQFTCNGTSGCISLHSPPQC